MTDAQLSFRKSANIDRVTDKRKDSLFRLVDTDGSGTIDAQEFAVLYDAIKKDLAEELEKEAALQKEASSARRRFKMLLLFVAVLVSFLAASVAANFAVIFTVVDQAITTTTTSSGLLEVKGTDTIAKTATATQDVPLIIAPALDLNTLSQVKSLQVTYREVHPVHGANLGTIEAALTVVAVRKHNSTFVEFVTDGAGETVEALNGVASVVRYPTATNGLKAPLKFQICAANATCSAFRASGIDVDAALEVATDELVKAGFLDGSRRLQAFSWNCGGTPSWKHKQFCGFSWEKFWQTWNGELGPCAVATPSDITYVGAFWMDSSASADRDVVLFTHGKTSDSDASWCFYCVCTDTEDCPYLKITDFEDLIFVYITSNITDVGGSSYAGDSGWSTDIDDAGTYADAAALVSEVFCDAATLNSCDPSLGWFSGIIETGFKMMVVGFSDGAGFAVYLQWYMSKTVKAVTAMDYWAFNSYDTWLTYEYTHVVMKIYTSCASPIWDIGLGTAIFEEAAPTPKTIPELGRLGIKADSATMEQEQAVDGTLYDFREWKWLTPPKCGRYLKFAIEGFTDTSEGGAYGHAGGSSSWPTSSSSTCSTALSGVAGGDIHVAMAMISPVAPDISEFVDRTYTRRRELAKARDDDFGRSRGPGAPLKLMRYDPCLQLEAKEEKHSSKRELEDGRELRFKMPFDDDLSAMKFDRGGDLAKGKQFKKVEVVSVYQKFVPVAKKVAAKEADTIGKTKIIAANGVDVILNPIIEAAIITVKGAAAIVPGVFKKLAPADEAALVLKLKQK